MNSANIVGRLVYEPELKKSADGTSYMYERVAVKRPRTSDKTDFLPVTLWRQSAEFLSNYAHKGDMVGITGSFRSDEFTNANGAKETRYTIAVDAVSILSSKPKTAAEKPENSPKTTNQRSQAMPQTAPVQTSFKTRDISVFGDISDDDLPF